MGSVPGQNTMIPHAMGQLSPHATVKSLHSQKKQKQNNNKKRTVVQGNGRRPCLLIGFTEAKKKKLSHILRLDCFTTWSKVTIAVGIFYFFLFFFICSEFFHTLEWNSHGFTCVPHPDPPSRLPLHPLPLGFPSAPGPSACLMHPTWAGDLFHPRYYTCFDAVLLKHPTLSFSHRV